MVTIAVKKAAFLRRYNSSKSWDVALCSGIAAAVGHNSLYNPAATSAERESVRCKWREFLTAMGEKYDAIQPVAVYENDIETLSARMNIECGRFFYSGKHPKFKTAPGFRISHAQKSLSVFLKHLWCMGKVAIPPQCPVDRIILEKAGKKYPDTKWGYVNSIEEHRAKTKVLIAAKNAIDKSLSLAEWELLEFKIWM